VGIATSTVAVAPPTVGIATTIVTRASITGARPRTARAIGAQRRLARRLPVAVHRQCIARHRQVAMCISVVALRRNAHPRARAPRLINGRLGLRMRRRCTAVEHPARPWPLPEVAARAEQAPRERGSERRQACGRSPRAVCSPLLLARADLLHGLLDGFGLLL
jgi:hypothetical protein